MSCGLCDVCGVGNYQYSKRIVYYGRNRQVEMISDFLMINAQTNMQSNKISSKYFKAESNHLC